LPRKPRIFIEGGTYHVYCRDSRGEAVFADIAEATAFVDTLPKVKDRAKIVREEPEHHGRRRLGRRGFEKLPRWLAVKHVPVEPLRAGDVYPAGRTLERRVWCQGSLGS
jgi:hypothetical protein